MSEHALAALFKNKKSRARADEHMLPINDSLDIWEALSSILSSTIVYLKLCIETHEGGKKNITFCSHVAVHLPILTIDISYFLKT